MDESGDHGLNNFDINYPIFVLAAVVLDTGGRRKLESGFSFLKRTYFGTEAIIFHEREIRRREKPFDNLEDVVYSRFIVDLTKLIDGLDFKVIAAVIDKRRLVQAYDTPRNPYEIALGFIMERVAMEVGLYHGLELPMFIEGRGKKEDRELLRVFRALRSGRDPLSLELRYGARVTLAKMRLHFHSKLENIAGLQLADLVARPIGLRYLHPDQTNRAFEVIDSKLRRGPQGQVIGYGLKIFPKTQQLT